MDKGRIRAMVNSLLKFVFAISMLFLASCARNILYFDVNDLWDNPRLYNGRVVDLEFYPYDIHGSGYFYIVCMEPCSRDQAMSYNSAIIAHDEDAYRGYMGDRKISSKAVFDGSCFLSGSTCLMDHFTFIFKEIE